MKPLVNRYYQHKYGGLYRVTDISTSTVDKSLWVVYSHCYPFEYQVFHRPLEEFVDGRFTLITSEEYNNFLKKDRTQFQMEIGMARGAKR